MNSADRLVSYFNPVKGAARARARQVIAAYESVRPQKGRPAKASKESLAALAKASQLPLAQQARFFDENFPIVPAMLDELAKNVVGTGIKVNPQPKLKDGTLADGLAAQIKRLYEQHERHFGMDGRTHKSEAEYLAFRTAMRDGEMFSRVYFQGGHDYLGAVHVGLENFECDHIDAGLTDKKLKIFNGCKLGKYNRIEGYFYNPDPGAFSQKPILLPASEILHVKHSTRIGALRGISKLAPVLGTVKDLAQYSEAEKLAKLVAARITIVHKKAGGGNNPLDLDTSPAYDDKLAFGHANVTEIGGQDDVRVLESAKGASDTINYIKLLQREITSGGGASNSSTTSNYEKSYSAQRQELIDRWAGYLVLRMAFINAYCRPAYELFVNAAFVQGLLRLPPNFDITTLYDAEYTGAVMPWIDPKKEAESIRLLKETGMLPLTLALAQRGLDVRAVLHAYRQERDLMGELDLDDLARLEQQVTNAKGANNDEKE